MVGILDLNIVQGDTWNNAFIVLADNTGEPLDLSSYVLNLQVKTGYGGVAVLTLNTDNGRIVYTDLKYNRYLGDWDEITEYREGDLVRHNSSYYVLISEDDKISPDKSEGWAVYKHISFNLSSSDTTLLSGIYVYDLEVVGINNKFVATILKGKFVISPEVSVYE